MKGSTAMIMMAVIGGALFLFGTVLMFMTIFNTGWVRRLKHSSRVKHGLFSAITMIFSLIMLVCALMSLIL